MALDVNKLKDNIQTAIEDTFTPALQVAFKKVMPGETVASDTAAKTFATTFVDLCAEPFAEQLASAIDYYIKNANIHGQMMLLGVSTVGSMTAQSQVVPLTLKASTHPVGQGGGTLPMINEFYLGIE